MAEIRKSRARMVGLECPQCHKDLDGMAIDKVFFCSKCSIGVDFYQNPVHIVPVSFADVSVTSCNPVIWLPVWHFDVQVDLHARDVQLMTEARCHSPETAWVFAFLIHRMHLYGNPHVEFTRSRPSFTFGGHTRNLTGVQVRKEEAVRFLHPVVTATIDRDVDVTGLDISIDITDCHLRAIPAILRPKSLEIVSSTCTINRASVIMNAWLEKIEGGDPDVIES